MTSTILDPEQPLKRDHAVPQQITINLDRVGDAALAVLTSDGTPIASAVHAAIIDAAERRAVPWSPGSGTSEDDRSRIAEILGLIGDVPPLSAHQRDLLGAVFGSGTVLVGQT
jgi:hypothetical protein